MEEEIPESIVLCYEMLELADAIERYTGQPLDEGDLN